MPNPVRDIEAQITERFATRDERFQCGVCDLGILLPRAADELLDEEAFTKDERMPYWADLWPSARALARHLIENPPFGQRVIELGCGLALPSIVLQSMGFDVIATDHNADGLLFAQANASRNGLGTLRTALFDWREPVLPFEPAELAIAADVLYERRNAVALVEVLPRVVKPCGRFVLADPGRRWAPDFEALMKDAGWQGTERDRIEVPQQGGSGPSSRIRITEWIRPS